MRRYTRLSNGFSRKIENHAAATALNYFAYNFIQDSPYTANEPGYGCWRDRSALERRGLGSPLGSLRAAEGGKSGSMKPSLLEEWCASRCDGIWEHGYGVRIETLDNPGWRVKIGLHDTPKELQELERVVIQRETQNDWIQYWTEDKAFHVACGPLNLSEALEIFVQWFNSK
jgi:hypothetical protein